MGAPLPLFMGQLVKDSEKRWRFIRVASVALAVINEGTYACRVQQQRCEARQER